MTTSGTYTYNPESLDLIDEAFERAGVDGHLITGTHVSSALRSFNLLFSEWESRGLHQFRIDQQTHTVATDDVSFALPAGTIDIVNAVLRRDGIDTPMQRIGRDQYLAIPDKTQTGRPTSFFVDKSLTPTCYFWLAAENSTDIIVYDRVVMFQDITTAQAGYTSGVPPIYMEALAAGLAARVAQKFNPSRYQELKAEARETFKLAFGEDRERAPTEFEIRSGRR
jgi:hypothetical protein